MLWKRPYSLPYSGKWKISAALSAVINVCNVLSVSGVPASLYPRCDEARRLLPVWRCSPQSDLRHVCTREVPFFPRKPTQMSQTYSFCIHKHLNKKGANYIKRGVFKVGFGNLLNQADKREELVWNLYFLLPTKSETDCKQNTPTIRLIRWLTIHRV